MKRKERSSGYSDRTKSIIRHIDQAANDKFSASQCIFHFRRPCIMILNNCNLDRFHCLYSNQSVRWRSYSPSTQSCDLPEHLYDLIILNSSLGDEYVLPFAGHFRESSGYTVGMYKQGAKLYPPSIIGRAIFKETVYALIIFFCAVCHRLGGNTPNIKYFSFVYTEHHPVLCDIGSVNADNRERLTHRDEHFNKKKWVKFMKHKTLRDIVRYLRIVFPQYFQKKQKGKACILNEEEEDCFDGETHRLLCRSENKCLLELVKNYSHLMPNANIRHGLVNDWMKDLIDEETMMN